MGLSRSPLGLPSVPKMRLIGMPCPLTPTSRSTVPKMKAGGPIATSTHRRQIEPDDLGGLGGEIGIIAFAPRLARRKIDLLNAQEAPDILHIDGRRAH